MARLRRALRTARDFLRQLTGDDAYERYLAHRRRRHCPDAGPPLTRREFFLAEQQRKWNRPNRCC